MSSHQDVNIDRQHLLDRLLDAVKQCQVRFGGRSELAADNDSRVVCLCAQFEIVLQHGMKKATINPLNAIKQMTGISVTGLPYLKPEADTGLWPVVREHLTRHELQRFLSLKNITTDAGRGRAWLRSTLNEHSLERYMHMILGSSENLRQYYEPWSFLLDEERSSMLPSMARGLGSILFAINIDNEELNGPKQVTPTLTSLMQSTEVVRSDSLDDADPEPVYARTATANPTAPTKEKKEKKKKKKKGAISIVSFNDSDTGSTVRHRSSSSPKRKGRSRIESVESNESSSTGVESPAHTNSRQSSKVSKDHHNVSITDELESEMHIEQNIGYIPSMEADGTINHDINCNHPIQISVDPSPQALSNGPDISLRQTIPTSRNQSYPVNTGGLLESRSSIDQSQLSTSFPIKTPPSSLNESAAAQYDRIRNTVDANDIAKQLRTVACNNVDTSPPRSASPAMDEKAESVDESSGSDRLTNTEVTGRDSPVAGTRGSFQILGGQDTEAMFPVSPDARSQQDDTQSNDSSMLGFGAETDNAALGLLLAQKGLAESMHQSRRKASGEYPNGSGDDLSQRYQTMSKEELRQAVLAMMTRNDELQDQNRSLRSLLDSEMEHAARMRGELETHKQCQTDSEEKLKGQIQALSRENDVLKHQLKKYVGAVQLLRRDGPSAIDGLPGMRLDEPQPPIPEQTKSQTQELLSQQEADYERKLIQVAEMHGELMEFNDYMSRQLKTKETIISRLKEELVDLRGPLPEDLPSDPNSPVSEFEPFSTATSRPLINVWIPSAFMRGKGNDAFHVYQVYVRIKDEEWNIYKRYSQFREQHMRLRKSHPIASTFEFPPKKAIGSKDAKFVEERRKKLQKYLRCVLNFCVKSTAELSERPCKEMLTSLMPFFSDSPKKTNKPAVTTGGKPKLFAGRKGTSTPEYDGL